MRELSEADRKAIEAANADSNRRWELTMPTGSHAKPDQFANREPVRQAKLLDGLDCLPGQLDLF